MKKVVGATQIKYNGVVYKANVPFLVEDKDVKEFERMNFKVYSHNSQDNELEGIEGVTLSKLNLEEITTVLNAANIELPDKPTKKMLVAIYQEYLKQKALIEAGYELEEEEEGVGTGELD